MPAPGYSSLAAVARAFRIVETLVGQAHGLSVTEISDRVGVSKSVVSRILATLEESGYVETDPLTRYYRLTLDFLALAYQHADTLGLDRLFHPILQRLADETGEMVQLALRRGEHLFFIAKVEGQKPLKVASMLGRRAPLHATAAGKVWLAGLPDDHVLRLLAKNGMKPYTENTIVSPTAFLEELQEVRKQGYALSRAETNPGVVAIAVPVRTGQEGEIVGGLTVAIPEFYATEDRIEEILAASRRAAERLNELLAGSGLLGLVDNTESTLYP